MVAQDFLFSLPRTYIVLYNRHAFDLVCVMIRSCWLGYEYIFSWDRVVQRRVTRLCDRLAFLKGVAVPCARRRSRTRIFGFVIKVIIHHHEFVSDLQYQFP
jgi:hypothetical protein